ncbi:MAG: pteridine reductase [Betaproteobacteria bacterium]|nr:pteridine reductase [Betaproteobacteria bacterium]
MPDSRVVLITGAARRVGAAIARQLHTRGCRIALHYRGSKAAAHALAESLNAARAGSVLTVQADLLDAGALPELVETVATYFGQLDGLVNNASSFFPTPLGQIDEAEWTDLIGSNLKAPLFLAQAAAPHLCAAQGGIVNIVDIHAERPLPGYALYSTAKAGLLGLTRSLAIELAPRVRVNGVAPGVIEWPEDGQFSAVERETIVDHTLLKRMGSPQDIALAVAFLLLDAPYITGQILAVDGGRSIHL